MEVGLGGTWGKTQQMLAAVSGPFTLIKHQQGLGYSSATLAVPSNHHEARTVPLGCALCPRPADPLLTCRLRPDNVSADLLCMLRSL